MTKESLFCRAANCVLASKSHLPRLGLPAFMLFPVYLTAFSYWTIGMDIGTHYIVDVLTFCCGFYLVGLLVSSLPNALARGLLMGLLCAVPIMFNWINLLFFYFFWDWLPFDAVWLIPDLRDVGSGIPKLYGTADLVTGLVIPTLLAACALGLKPRRVRSAALTAGCLMVPLLTLDQLGGRRFNDADPFMTFLRQGVAQLAESCWGAASYQELIKRRDLVLPLDAAGYRYAASRRGLLLKEPADTLTNAAANATPRRNVVLVLMESFRAYESGTYGARPSFTPFLDRLAEESLVFENFYANGVQTVRGEFSLLASQYDHLGGSPNYVLYPFVHLTTLPSILKAYGYQTSQIQAYNGDFQNQRLFLSGHGVDRIYDWNDMPQGQTLSWGLNDESMFDRAIEIIGTQHEPFFTEIVTLSNHFPFDAYPTDSQCPVAAGSDTYVAYTKGICYTDHALAHFLARARQQPWFDNTIFVFTADHGLFLFPDDLKLSQVQRQEAAFRIPLLIYAPGYIMAGRRGVVGSQVDVAPTLLDLLRIRHPNTFLGRSLVEERIAGATRFALLVQQSNWFLRWGNRYYYCGSPTDEAPALDFTHGYVEAFGRERTAIGFRTSKDLLRNNPSDAVMLDPAEARDRRQWGEDMIEMTRLAIQHDWVLMEDRTPNSFDGSPGDSIREPRRFSRSGGYETPRP